VGVPLSDVMAEAIDEVRVADTIVCAENVDYRRLKLGVEPVDVVRRR